jgi:hypothetical protein
MLDGNANGSGLEFPPASTHQKAPDFKGDSTAYPFELLLHTVVPAPLFNEMFARALCITGSENTAVVQLFVETSAWLRIDCRSDCTAASPLLFFALLSAASTTAESMAMMAITTRSSIRVKPRASLFIGKIRIQRDMR